MSLTAALALNSGQMYHSFTGSERGNRKGVTRKATESCRKAAEKSEFRGSLAWKCAAFGEYPVVTLFPVTPFGASDSLHF